MLRHVRNAKKQLTVYIMLMLVLLPKVTAQSVTLSQKEKTDSENDARNGLTTRAYDDKDIERIMEIAEEEIEKTSQEAVKAVLEDVGGELAYEKERADQLEIRNAELGIRNDELEKALEKKKDSFWYGTLIGGTGGAIVTSIVFMLIQGFCK